MGANVCLCQASSVFQSVRARHIVTSSSARRYLKVLCIMQVFLRLEMRDDLKMKRDPHLGVALLRVDDALRVAGVKGQTVVVPIRNSSNAEVANIGVLLQGQNTSVPKGRVLRSKAGGTPTTVEEPETLIKSFTGRVVRTSGLPQMKKPYVMFNSGKYEIRLPHGTNPDSQEYFECPYKLNEAAT